MRPGKILKILGWSAFLLYLFSLTVYFNMAWLKKHNPAQTKLMQYRKLQAQKRGQGYEIDHRFVSLSQISKPMLQAVIIAEDSNFYRHHGFDVQAIWDGLWSNIRSGRVRFGGSTISQQLAKNLFLYPKRSLWRKAQEAMLTLRMEGNLSKARIMELYLNSIEWGYGIYGVEAAAWHYFDIPASELDERQAAFLAALIQAPLAYNSEKETAYFKQRYQWVYALMSHQEQAAVAEETMPMLLKYAFRVREEDQSHFDEQPELNLSLFQATTPAVTNNATVSSNNVVQIDQ